MKTHTTKPKPHITPSYEIGEPAARLLDGNVINAAGLAQALSVSLPQLSRLNAGGVIFRHSQGKYHLAESVSNYFAYKSHPLSVKYDEARAHAEAEGYADPAGIARAATAWPVPPSDVIEIVRQRRQPFVTYTAWSVEPGNDVETARRRCRNFDVVAQVAEFQRALRMRRMCRRDGGYKAEHCDAASAETFQLLKHIGLNDSAHATFDAHWRAHDETWTPAQAKTSKAAAKALNNQLRRAEVAAAAVAGEEAAQASRRG
ncbi:MAG: hypothetical protein LBM04_10740 [Opitutaceae bacterium]|nr:hypothetical protein [Opitutaceae bacterium]